MITLYSGPLSLFARKVEIALAEKGLPFERIMVPFSQTTGYEPKHPEVVAKMREEVDRVVGDRVPTAEDVAQLHYVRRVIDEILRVRSPVWCTARDAAEPDVLQGFRVEKGDLVMPLFYLTHRHPEFWKNPEAFDPDRFAPEQSKGRHHWSYLPFSMGPRICIGNVFSLTEGALLFATLLQQIEWSMDGDDVAMEADGRAGS